ncbi:glycosyltransferase family 2 protein [Stipitochalara longipes BDJ]|nr:glycosyltransferase family 2 protein [Stipitochalara longipes BDJ]
MLTFLRIWRVIDYYVNRNYASKYRPVPIDPNPIFTPNDVSVIVCTLKPHTVFKACLVRWFENKPAEIIICTTKEHIEEVKYIVNEAVLEGIDRSKVKILVSEMGARNQLMKGVWEAKGKIIATSDNHIFWSRNYLINMLPCFEDADVGAAAPEIKVYIPEERRAKITPWEVAAVKLANRGPGSATMMHVAARWCWIIVGTSGIYRAHILKDPEFAKSFLNDFWNGMRLDVGNDTFISRWLLKHGWVIAIQWTKETRVWRTVKQTGALIPQMLRWERSTIQSFLRTVTEVPQMNDNFIVAFRTYERILKAPLAFLHLVCWILSFYSYPMVAFPLLAYYVYYKYLEYVKFFDNYPYMRRYWWAAVMVDFSPVIIGLQAWRTLSDTSWEHGEGGRKVL